METPREQLDMCFKNSELLATAIWNIGGNKAMQDDKVAQENYVKLYTGP